MEHGDASDRGTIYAKPFPKTTTEELVRELFSVYGSIRRVKLRREAATNSFRGSVYIEYETPAAAHAAVASPPLQPQGASAGSAQSRFTVMMKSDYERKRNATSSAGGAREGGGGGGSAHKRPRLRSEGPTSSSQQQAAAPPPPPPPHHLGEEHGTTPVSEHFLQQQQQQQQQWRQLADERAGAIRTLEESLRKEKEESQRLFQRLAEAQHRAQEAASREAAANQKLLARDVEIGALKGEIAMLRTQSTAQLERQSTAHKARISELEAALQRVKDTLLEKERSEREQQKKAARENGAGKRPGASGSAGTGADGDLDL